MSESGVVFLMYHELELPGRELCQREPGYVRYVLHTADFRSQMELLKSSGMRGTSVGEALGSFPDNTAVVTFDDGSETDLIAAAPALCDFNFGATFYLTYGFLGTNGFLSHAQARELSGLGFEIGCHSMTHPYLTDLDDVGLHREIAVAKDQLEQMLGKPIHHFSCPGGRYNHRVAAVARQAGYRSVVTSRVQKNFPSTDRMALGRVSVMRTTSLSTFRDFFRGRNFWRMNVQNQLISGAKTLLGNSLYDRLRGALLR